MVELTLSSENVVDFLQSRKICPPDFQPVASIVRQQGSNFNLIVPVDGEVSFLVKQGRLDSENRVLGGLPVEWIVQKAIDSFPGLASLQPLLSKVLLLDWSNCILVSVFYNNYQALDKFYAVGNNFYPEISAGVGANLAKIHRATYRQQVHLDFLKQYLELNPTQTKPNFLQRIANLDSSVMGRVCADGLDFYRLYQRFPSLEGAINELYSNLEPSCLIHNDLTLDNLIVDRQLDWDSDSVEILPEQIKIIDWERIDWGDPAVDLGMVISEYIGGIWLGSLISDRHIDINTMLKLAAFPLEIITPTLKALMQGYIHHFPEIIAHRPDFIQRVVQFIGIGILNRLSYYVEHHYPFQNNSICKLQVAKNLLCQPQAGVATIFGASEADLLGASSIAA